MQRKWLGYGGVATFLLLACSGTAGSLTFLGMNREDARGWEDQATSIFSSDRAAAQRDQAGTPFCVTCGQTFKCTVTYGDKSASANIQIKCPSTTQSQLCTDTGELSSPSTSNKSDKNQTPGQDQQGGSGSSGGGDGNRSNYSIRILPGGGYGVTYSINGVTYDVSCYPTTEAPTVTVSPTGTGTSTNPPGTATATATDNPGPTTDPYGRCTDSSQCQGAANSTCSVATKTCQPPCEQTTDCPAGGGTPICTGGKCYLTCSTQNPNCPNGMVCLAGTLCGHN